MYVAHCLLILFPENSNTEWEWKLWPPQDNFFIIFSKKIKKIKGEEKMAYMHEKNSSKKNKFRNFIVQMMIRV